MYQEFGNSKGWKRIFLPSIILIGCFSIPVSAFFAYLAIERMEIEGFLVFAVSLLCVFIFPIKHLRDLYVLPLVAMDENFIVVSQPFQGRRVYTLAHISNVRAFFKSVFFLHNKCPVLLTMNALDEDERCCILKKLKSARQRTHKADA